MISLRQSCINIVIVTIIILYYPALRRLCLFSTRASGAFREAVCGPPEAPVLHEGVGRHMMRKIREIYMIGEVIPQYPLKLQG